MKVAYIQTSPVFGRVEENVEKALLRLAKPDMAGAELIVLPELFSTGYQFRTKKEAFDLSENINTGYTVKRLIDACKAPGFKKHIVAGIAERYRGKVYNSAVIIGSSGVKGIYRKAHLFWNEKKIFTPGNTPFKVWKVGKARVGMMICFDWFFPEAARKLALLGADIICHPSNLVLPYCPEAMITRCLENRVFAVTANRVGTENRIKGKPLEFIGRSQIVSPTGRVLKRAGARAVAAGVVDIEPTRARDKKITPFNHIFRDRREELY